MHSTKKPRQNAPRTIVLYILIQHAFLSLIFTSAIFQRIEYGRLREAFVASFFVAMQSVKKFKILFGKNLGPDHVQLNFRPKVFFH